MPTLTYDAQSFLLDGRRLWVTGCVLQYTRVPREEWSERIHAAKLCGFNTIVTSAVWQVHEPRPGQYDFDGAADLRHFLELCQRAGVYCIVKLGPFVGEDFDAGGLPTWLLRRDDVKLRAANGPFLESCSRYFSALADQIRDLQATATGGHNPVLAVQLESGWTCGDEGAAESYLGELARYAREAGFSVPTINANNLWQGLENEVDTWVGREQMIATLRQLSSVVTDKPKLISRFELNEPICWGSDGASDLHPLAIQRRLAEILAGGGQFVISPLTPGIAFGFGSGRFALGDGHFCVPSQTGASPLDEAGAPTDAYGPIRRIASFSNNFAKLFAVREPDYHPTTLDPMVKPAGKEPRFIVLDTRGPQGRVAFVMSEEPEKGAKSLPKERIASLLLAGGEPLRVDLGSQAVSWVLFDYHLAGRVILSYSTLNAFASLGTSFVCFGQSGSEGEVAINGSPLTVTVPKGKEPLIVEHEGATIVVCSEQQIDTCYVADDAVYVGVAGLAPDGSPIPLPGGKHAHWVDKNGRHEKVVIDGAPPARTSIKTLSLDEWKIAPAIDYAGGSSPRYAAIDGPGDLIDLGVPFGYGWYRLEMSSTAPKKLKLHMPEASDRIQLFQDGESLGVFGKGPGVEELPLTLSLKKGSQTIVALADNLGRASEGMHLDEKKGLYGHLWETTPIKAGKPKAETADPVNLLAWRSPMWELRPGDTSSAERVSWSFVHRKKSPVLLRYESLMRRVLLILNGEPVELFDRPGTGTRVFTAEELNRGNNTFQIALVEETPDDAAELKALAGSFSFEEASNCATEKAKWSFAKWEPPAPTAYKAPTKTEISSTVAMPTWWRTNVQLPAESGESPTYFEPKGLTKGQIYINGRHVSSYFVAEKPGASGRAVGPQSRYLLPKGWLEPGTLNELTIFDEQGGNPTHAKIVVDTSARVMARPGPV